MIEAKTLCVKEGERVLLDGLSFVMEGKGIHGVLGPVGSGKTALTRVLMGDLFPTSGELLLDGESVAEDRSPSLLARKKKIGYMPTDLTPYEDMTLYELLVFVGGIKKMDSERLYRQAMEALRLVELEDYINCLISKLNNAKRRRFAIAVSLIGNPELLILDEPTAGLGAVAAEEIRALVEMLGTKKMILLCTRFPEEAEALCSDLLMLSRGQQVVFDTTENLNQKLRKTENVTLTVRAPKPLAEALCEKLMALSGVVSCKTAGAAKNGGYTLKLETKPASDRRRQIEKLLAEEGSALLTFESMILSLEDAYLALTEPVSVSVKEPKKPSGKREKRKEENR